MGLSVAITYDEPVSTGLRVSRLILINDRLLLLAAASASSIIDAGTSTDIELDGVTTVPNSPFLYDFTSLLDSGMVPKNRVGKNIRKPNSLETRLRRENENDFLPSLSEPRKEDD